MRQVIYVVKLLKDTSYMENIINSYTGADGMAQVIECRPLNSKIVGSNPSQVPEIFITCSDPHPLSPSF